MKRPWKVISHAYNAHGVLVERVSSFSTLARAVNDFEVAVLFDVTSRLEYRGGAEGPL